MVDIDPQHLAEQAIRILRVIGWIIRRTGVTNGDVKQSIGSEGEHSSIVFSCGVRMVRMMVSCVDAPFGFEAEAWYSATTSAPSDLRV
jgi:hypothetical protein